MSTPIRSLSGPWRFLSNFWPSPVILDGHSYRSVEHAYQAAKTIVPEHRTFIRVADGPADAKRRGKTITVREGWADMRLAVMEDLLRQKFATDPLRKKLKDTGKREIIEGNWWGDYFWGISNGRGENHLGKLLMKIRSEL